MQYYIIKDKNTGNYYRGKGVNRWGKFYNQASIFRILGQAIESLEHIKNTRKFHNELGVDPVIMCIKIMEEGELEL